MTTKAWTAVNVSKCNSLTDEFLLLLLFKCFVIKVVGEYGANYSCFWVGGQGKTHRVK